MSSLKFSFTEHSTSGKKPPNSIKMIRNPFFASVPKSPTQMGSHSVKNARPKFYRLGTLTMVRFDLAKWPNGNSWIYEVLLNFQGHSRLPLLRF